MGRLQGKYCQYFNASHKRKGSLWHDRFFSCALGGVHLIEALRYVDRNPVRAGIAVDSLDYPWSSACVHAGCEDTAGLIDLDSWHRIVDGLDWNGFLREGDNERALTVIREHTRTGSPLGVKK
jgi:putative transposase